MNPFSGILSSSSLFFLGIRLIFAILITVTVPVASEWISRSLGHHPERQIRFGSAAAVTIVFFFVNLIAGFLAGYISIIIMRMIPLQEFNGYWLLSIPGYLISALMWGMYLLVYSLTQKLNRKEVLTFAGTIAVMMAIVSILNTVLIRFLYPVIRHYNS